MSTCVGTLLHSGEAIIAAVPGDKQSMQGTAIVLALQDIAPLVRAEGLVKAYFAPQNASCCSSCTQTRPANSQSCSMHAPTWPPAQRGRQRVRNAVKARPGPGTELATLPNHSTRTHRVCQDQKGLRPLARPCNSHVLWLHQSITAGQRRTPRRSPRAALPPRAAASGIASAASPACAPRASRPTRPPAASWPPGTASPRWSSPAACAGHTRLDAAARVSP